MLYGEDILYAWTQLLILPRVPFSALHISGTKCVQENTRPECNDQTLLSPSIIGSGTLSATRSLYHWHQLAVPIEQILWLQLMTGNMDC